MKKVKLKKLIPLIILSILVIYLLCLVYCMVAAFQMKSINYSSSGFGVVMEEYELNYEENSAALSHYDYDGNVTEHTEAALTSAQKTKVRLICAVSLMPMWRSRYVNPAINDGNQWRMIISYKGKEKEVYGSNLSPLTFSFVEDAIMTIFEAANNDN